MTALVRWICGPPQMEESELSKDSVLANADLCRHIASFCNCPDLGQLELVSKIWQGVVVAHFQDMRYNGKDAYLLFKDNHRFHSDKVVCSRLFSNRRKENGQIFLMGGAMHANDKHTYMMVDNPTPDMKLNGGNDMYIDSPHDVVCHAGVTCRTGKYLMIGGWKDSTVTAVDTVLSYDLYASNLQVENYPNLPEARCFGAADCTLRGDVVHTGGATTPYAITNALSNVSLLKVDTPEWLSGVVPNMSQIRGGHRAVTLLNGSILIAGGYAGNNTFLNSTELLDAHLDRWTSMPAMHEARSGAGSVLGPGGAMHMVGGTNDSFNGLRSLERFDPRVGKWEMLSGMIVPRSFVTACNSVHDGFYVMGGIHMNVFRAGMEFYDYRTNKWRFVIGGEDVHSIEVNKVSGYMVHRM
eukprot:gene10152-11890_t